MGKPQWYVVRTVPIPTDDDLRSSWAQRIGSNATHLCDWVPGGEVSARWAPKADAQKFRRQEDAIAAALENDGRVVQVDHILPSKLTRRMNRRPKMVT